MTISAGYKAITVPWASSTTADKTPPEDTTLDPPLDVTVGWPSSFSVDGGDKLRRAVMNSIFNRRDSALVDVRNHGILPWDTALDTLQGGIKTVAGVPYRALVDNGPTYSNAVNPTTANQTVWASLSGDSGAPDQPAAPRAATPRSGELDWFWTCPLDNGAAVTAFDFQWRQSGTDDWGRVNETSVLRFQLLGLTNGQSYEARVRARNSEGTSPWSTIGLATPTGTAPAGGSELALRGTPGSMQVALDWLEPDDGGSDILAYLLQWRARGQSYSTGRQIRVITLAYTVVGLVNGTDYFFRVRAINNRGNSAWSNEAIETPVAPPPPPPVIPDDTEPLKVPAAPTGRVIGLSVLWDWPVPLSGTGKKGGERITGFDFQWRVKGQAWAGNITNAVASCRHVTGLVGGTTYQGRARAVNAIGSGPWSDLGEVRLGVPAATGLAGVGSGTNVSWTWDAISGVDGYHLEIRQGSASWERVTLNATSRTTTGHRAGTSVQGRVRGYSGERVGEWDNASASIVPAAPALSAFATTGQVTFSWTEPANGGAAVTGYIFEHRARGSGQWTRVTLGASTRRRVVTGVGDIEGRVLAQNRAGNGPYSPARIGASTLGRSATLTGTGSGTSVTWTWDAVPGATRYRLETRQGSGSWAGGTITGRTRDTTGHRAGTAVQGRVRAETSTLTGDYVTATAGIIPAAPRLGGSVQTATVTFSWNAPSNGGAAITGYTFQWRSVGAREWESASLGPNVRGRSLSGLTPFEARVSADNSAGSGPWSSTHTLQAGVPSPGSFAGTGSGTSVRWSWATVSGATGYELQTRQGNGQWASVNLGSGATSRTTTGHRAGTSVQGRIRAIVGGESSEFSTATAAIVPGAPFGLTSSSNTLNRVQLSWSAPSNGGAAITGYEVRFRRTGTLDYTINAVSGRTVTVDATNTLEWNVRALNSAGSGAWSTQHRGRVLIEVPRTRSTIVVAETTRTTTVRPATMRSTVVTPETTRQTMIREASMRSTIVTPASSRRTLVSGAQYRTTVVTPAVTRRTLVSAAVTRRTLVRPASTRTTHYTVNFTTSYSTRT